MPSYQRSIPLPGKKASEIYSRISKALDKFLEKDTGKFGKFEVSRDDANQIVELKSAQVSAKLQCLDGEILLDGKLSFLLGAFRGKIDAGIDDWIAKSFKA